MKNPSYARSFRQCFICREWSWDVCMAYGLTELCLPCYVDVLEVRQGRGVDLTLGGGKQEPEGEQLREGPDSAVPPPFRQLDMFE